MIVLRQGSSNLVIRKYIFWVLEYKKRLGNWRESGRDPQKSVWSTGHIRRGSGHWVCLAWEKGKRFLIALGSREGEITLLLGVHSERTRGGGDKLQQGNFKMESRPKIIYPEVEVITAASSLEVFKTQLDKIPGILTQV